MDIYRANQISVRFRRKDMTYPSIKNAKLKHKDIAKAFGYKNVNSFRCSSAHKRIMQGVENILTLKNEI